MQGLCKVYARSDESSVVISITFCMHHVFRIAVILDIESRGKAELNEFEQLLSAVLAGVPWLSTNVVLLFVDGSEPLTFW